MILRVISALAATTLLLVPLQTDPPIETSLCELAERGSAWDGRRVQLKLNETWGGGMHGDIWWDPNCLDETAAVYFDFDQPEQEELHDRMMETGSSGPPRIPQDFELVFEATTSWGSTTIEGGEMSRPLATLGVSRLISARPIGYRYWCIAEVRERMRRWGATELCKVADAAT